MDPVLKSALEDVRTRAGGPGGKAFVSDVHTWLKQAGIDVTAYGAQNTKMLLVGLPAFCTVEAFNVRFLDGALPEPPKPKVEPKVEPKAAESDEKLSKADKRKRREDKLRKRWHAAIDDMSYEELKALELPERFQEEEA